MEGDSYRVSFMRLPQVVCGMIYYRKNAIQTFVFVYRCLLIVCVAVFIALFIWVGFRVRRRRRCSLPGMAVPVESPVAVNDLIEL